MRTLFTITLVVFCIIAFSIPALAFNTAYRPNTNTSSNHHYGDAYDPTGNTTDSRPLVIMDMIGDNDGYGYGKDIVGDGDDLPFTNSPVQGEGWLFDNRSEEEMNATNGAQATDVEDFFDVTFHHTFDINAFDKLSAAYFTIDMSGLQQGMFGSFSHLYLDGQEVAGFDNINQGTWGSNIFTYAVDVDMLRDGELDVFFSNPMGDYGDDHLAIDFTMLTVKGTASTAVPEPASMLLFGLGTLGMGIYRKYKK